MIIHRDSNLVYKLSVQRILILKNVTLINHKPYRGSVAKSRMQGPVTSPSEYNVVAEKYFFLILY
jgi:hypothetical protein